MSTFEHKALLPIIPEAETTFAITSSSAELLDSGSTIGDLFAGKMITIDTDAGTAYLRATYNGDTPGTAVTTNFRVAAGSPKDFFIFSKRCRVTCVSTEASTNLRIWVTSQ